MVVNDYLYAFIKQIAVNAVKSTHPSDWCYGYVKGIDPLNVSLAEKLEIDEDFIEFGSRKIEGLEVGDKLILLRKAGGQLFLCLDVIRQEGDQYASR